MNHRIFIITFIALIIAAFISPTSTQSSPQPKKRPVIPPPTNILSDYEPITIKIIIKNSTESILFEKSYNLFYTLEQEDLEEEISFLVNPYIQQNYTIFCSMFKEGDNVPLFHVQKNMTRYMKVARGGKGDVMMDLEMMGDLGQESGSDSGNENENGSGNQSQYGLRMPKKYTVLLLHAQDLLFHFSEYKQLFNFGEKRIKGQRFYIPPLDLSQLHVPFKTYTPLLKQKPSNITTPQSTQSLEQQQHQQQQYNMTLTIKIFSTSYFQLFYGFTQPQLMRDINPVMAEFYTDEMIDMIKQALFTNNFYLVLAYFILSFTQIFMQIFAFRSEIQAWKDVQKKGGLSIKSLYQHLTIEIIVILYLIDKDANKMYVFFSLLQLVLVVWKIFRAVEIRRMESFPYFRPGYKQWYHRKTQSVDNDAIHYTSYLTGVLFVLFLAYKFYSLYDPVKMWTIPPPRRLYSLCLEIAVGFIFVFGFVLMTPQLYINYRLKSVDHLPWKTLIYRFISTIIDDIFVFMIDLPMMQRMFSFRDDIIFVLYLIQRRIYRVDPSRIAMAHGGSDNNSQDQGKDKIQ